MDSYFPYFIIFPGFMVILIPIIARKRLEEQNKQEHSSNCLKEQSHKMSIKIKKEGLLAIGMFSLILSILLKNFAGKVPIVDFFCGLFTGLSITLNIGFLIRLKSGINKGLKN